MLEDFFAFVRQNPDQTSAIAAAISASAALFAAIVAFLSIGISVYALCIQRRHNRASVRPIANIGYFDYENEQSVHLRNVGLGPLKIDRFYTSCSISDNKQDSLIEHFSDQVFGDSWSNFTGTIDGKVLRPGGCLTLIKLQGCISDESYINKRSCFRNRIMNLQVNVEYSDLYGHRIGKEQKSLKWFGRHNFDQKFDRI